MRKGAEPAMVENPYVELAALFEQPQQDAGNCCSVVRGPAATLLLKYGDHKLATLQPDGCATLELDPATWIFGSIHIKAALRKWLGHGFYRYSGKPRVFIDDRGQQVLPYKQGMRIRGRYLEAWGPLMRRHATGVPNSKLQLWDTPKWPAGKSNWCQGIRGQGSHSLTEAMSGRYVAVKRKRKPGEGARYWWMCNGCCRKVGLVW